MTEKMHFDRWGWRTRALGLIMKYATTVVSQNWCNKRETHSFAFSHSLFPPDSKQTTTSTRTFYPHQEWSQYCTSFSTECCAGSKSTKELVILTRKNRICLGITRFFKHSTMILPWQHGNTLFMDVTLILWWYHGSVVVLDGNTMVKWYFISII